MILVIADDITGAAEMAGIAHRQGLSVCFSLAADELIENNDHDVLVLATDTRSEDEETARQTIRDIISHLTTFPQLLYKKVDSALRGHIVAEMTELMRNLGMQYALLIPQNPALGRTIEDGIYYIHGTPLHQTDFRFDPEYPVQTADVTEILAPAKHLAMDAPLEKGINIADGKDEEEVVRQLEKRTRGVLLAGGGFAFSSLLQQMDHNRDVIPFPLPPNKNTRTLVVCGSTQSKAIHDLPFFQQHDTTVITMPEKVFHGDDPTTWIEESTKEYLQHEATILRIGHEAVTTREYATRLKNTMALLTMQMIQKDTPCQLIIEGGATAYCILTSLGWHRFAIKKEIAPGVVCMTYHDAISSVDIILKPGSYPWGDLFD